ncbi:MAG: ribosome biogenesis GTPase Der [Rickettsiaceae bacterium]
MNKKPIISLVGRPNVGKSTLFNRLAIKNKAIVHDTRGVTRDRKYSDAQLSDLEFTIIDTPGLEKCDDDYLKNQMVVQTKLAIDESDLVCFLVDAKANMSADDQFYVNFVRKTHKQSILVINKCEKNLIFDNEYYKLGFDNIVAISAEHGLGMIELYEEISRFFSEITEGEINRGKDKLQNSKRQGSIAEENDAVDQFIVDKNLKIVIAGRPNVGKSTLINAIIDQNRLLVGDIAGMTRESIEIDWKYKDYNIKLIDTAGLRRKNLVTKKLEQLSTKDTISSIAFANIVFLMLDARGALEKQDLRIASHVIEDGRCLVIIINKWDLVPERSKKIFRETLFEQIKHNLSQAKGVPVIFISAITNPKVKDLFDVAINLYKLWNCKISTGRFNKWLQIATSKHMPPFYAPNRRINIKYGTQTKIRPPTFKLFVNNPDGLTNHYKRYITNSFRDNFSIPAVPIRFIFIKNKN